jgi:hypothetical protein
MAGWTCAGCTTTYTVGASKCPQCGSTERTDRAGGTVLPSVTVACGNEVCRYEGRERRVHLRTAAPGVVEVPRLACAGCGFDMPTVRPWPPVAESEDEDMAKIRVHGGVSDANAEEVEAGEDAPTGADSAPASEEETSSPEQAKSDSPPRARTTASRSKKARTE